MWAEFGPFDELFEIAGGVMYAATAVLLRNVGELPTGREQEDLPTEPLSVGQCSRGEVDSTHELLHLSRTAFAGMLQYSSTVLVGPLRCLAMAISISCREIGRASGRER